VAAIAAAWGSIGVLVRWIDLPSVAIVFARCALAATTLGLFLALRRRRRARPARAGRRAAWPGVVALGVALAAHWWFLVAAQQRAPVGTVLLITYLAPVVVTVLAPHLLHEAVPGRTYVAAAIGLAGVAVLVRPGAGLGAGELLALAAALTYAGITLGSKAVVGSVGGIELAFGQLTTAAVVLAPMAASADWGSPRIEWWWLVLLGVGLTAVLGAAYLTLLARLPASTFAVLTYVEPLAAVVFAWAFLAEVPTVSTVLGGALVIAAGIMVVPRAAIPAAAPERSVPRAVPR
jgi:drug/metabolite transporter (DMT)-like permease